MMEAILTIDMHSEWLVAGERDRSSGADSAQVRDGDGYPYVPGRSLRGLLREGAEMLVDGIGESARNELERLFGTEQSSGLLTVGDALLPEEVCDAIEGLDPQGAELAKRDLVVLIARTAIDPVSGGAKDHSLRMMEAAVPGLTLLAPVKLPDEAAVAFVATAAALVRRLGASRFRGLGRCSITLLVDGKEVDKKAFLKKNLEGVA